MTPALSVRDVPMFEGPPLSFDLRPGEILALIGDNGIGKSLLLSHLSGHLETAPGAVRVGDRALPAARPDLGVVFQHPGLIRNLTVFENVALPFLVDGLDLDDALAEKVRLRLRLVGCGDLEQESVHRLSEGDKRCVALARALSGHTRLLLADEPAAALSPSKQSLIEELLASLVRTGILTGIVLATQDLDFARRLATHFLLLRPGGHTLVRREDAEHDPDCLAFTTRFA